MRVNGAAAGIPIEWNGGAKGRKMRLADSRECTDRRNDGRTVRRFGRPSSRRVSLSKE